MNGWIPVSQLAREYNKSKMTIIRWIDNGFLVTLGYRIWRDVSGHYYVCPSSQASRVL